MQVKTKWALISCKLSSHVYKHTYWFIFLYLIQVYALSIICELWLLLKYLFVSQSLTNYNAIYLNSRIIKGTLKIEGILVYQDKKNAHNFFAHWCNQNTQELL